MMFMKALYLAHGTSSILNSDWSMLSDIVSLSNFKLMKLLDIIFVYKQIFLTYIYFYLLYYH